MAQRYFHFFYDDRKRWLGGFTLFELVIVIAIMATLGAITVPIFSSYIDRTNIAKAKAEVHMLEREISSYKMDKNQLPATIADLGLGNLLDPWGAPYQYLPVAGAKLGKLRKDHAMVPVNQDYDLYSMGKDGKSSPPFTAKASRDDVVRANDGQYIGLVSLY